MIRRIPVFATLVVVAAVATMIGLGLWQLQRLQWKEALLARYHRAEAMNSDAPWPVDASAVAPVLYRHATLDCVSAGNPASVAGRDLRGRPGIAHLADCTLAGGATARVVLGWSTNPAAVEWRGGRVQGTIAPGPRLVASPPAAGLEANARPDPADIPNNHLAYAIQWFLFAATALVIYGLALRKRLAAPPPPPNPAA
jgi:surfeit locus 1 family protein